VLERLFVLGGAIALLTLGVVLVRTLAKLRTRKVMAADGASLLNALRLSADTRPTIVAFSSRSCGACHTAQAPALDEVQRQLGAHGVRIHTVDVAEQPTAASAFGILTVPSTAVLGPDGTLQALNHGFAAPYKLIRQLSAGAGRSMIDMTPNGPASASSIVRLRPAPQHAASPGARAARRATGRR
jgi:thiol-disulfide isomerase/thioredoxin